LHQSARRASRGCPCRSTRRCDEPARHRSLVAIYAQRPFPLPGSIVIRGTCGPDRTSSRSTQTVPCLLPPQPSQPAHPESGSHSMPYARQNTPRHGLLGYQVHRFRPCHHHTINPYDYEPKMNPLVPIDTDYQPPNLPFYVQSIAESESDHWPTERHPPPPSTYTSEDTGPLTSVRTIWLHRYYFTTKQRLVCCFRRYFLFYLNPYGRNYAENGLYGPARPLDGRRAAL
jgi:hypothetical protein